jgi:hypothetical protein
MKEHNPSHASVVLINQRAKSIAVTIAMIAVKITA